MKQAPVEKYTIAFFRLAEYVSRGEKERALGVYRLLSHSFDDPAFARQLEGDILWSFKDPCAQDKYFQAAQLYQKDMRLRQAVGVYEHLITMYPKNALYLANVIEVYCQLDLPYKAKNYIVQSLDLATIHGNIPIVSALLVAHEILFSQVERAHNHEKLVFIAIKSKYSEVKIIQEHAQHVVDNLLALNHSDELKQFFQMLHALDGSLYLHAHNYYKTKNID